MKTNSDCLSNDNEKSWPMEQGGNHKSKIHTKFVRIEYPGIIHNTERAMDTLGGIHNIEMVNNN